MNILSLENVGKNYGVKPLFENATFGIEESDKIGIIGANGSGKTTLLKVIAGTETPDTGKVVRTQGKTLAYLAQNPTIDENATVLETIFAASGGVMRLIRDYEKACHDLATGDANQKLLEKVSALQHELEMSGGWEIETNARIVLDRLGIYDTSAQMKTLSGGQRKRVALAHELIFKPDILILDEPTNHLDADTIEWLEDYLKRYTGALLLVTHDRYFLDRVTNRIFEIDRGGVQAFAGNYAYYLEKKEEQEANRHVENHKREQLIKKELAWLRRGAKARTRKSKHRINAAYDLMAQPKERAKSEIDIAIGAQRLGSKIIELRDISKSYDGRRLVDDFSYLLKRDDRIGIIGANGAGKTTLLEIITRRIKPDAGEIEIGQTVKIGYYDQESRALDDEQRVIDYIRETAEYVTTVDGNQITAGQMLEKFLFPPAAQYSLIANLSGGERRRLYLLKILMDTPNVLLLDEPTNDLDIPTLIALEEYLDDFAGALVVVSHDRYFLDRTIDSIFKFADAGKIREYAGDYSAYLEIAEREETEQSKIRASAKINNGAVNEKEKSKPLKLSFKEKRELESLETRVGEAETRLAEIAAELTLFASDAYKVNGLFTEQQQLTERLDKDMERWAELSERDV
ncbi:MAG: Bis-ABC ATPase Uup [uncultured Pyrinomonadaceae bacterium]|uniref:Bis-ABC ATPase Uup n=1 Tax=uncultured Pyrinomonadaceae bacterium TaxID=2283094 RepID=A0A6J4P621_9BACT|nr:MAG: Bis-ABC ATPase Uup [uncultured Pyrinomonadaceae bacterium]